MSIRAHEICFSYPRSSLVLDRVSCDIESGKLTAIVGPNGGGKSTLVRLLAGLRTPDSGKITLEDQEVCSLSPKARAKNIAFIEQRPSLAFDFPARTIIEFGDYAGSASPAYIDDAIQRFDLSSIISKSFGHLSVGQQQRVSIARAWVQIIGNPSGFLLADEPCSAMDPRFTLQTMQSLRDLADLGVGVGVVIHDLTLAARWAHNAIVLDQSGQIASQGSVEDAMDEKILSEVFQVQIRKHDLEESGSVLIPSANRPRS